MNLKLWPLALLALMSAGCVNPLSGVNEGPVEGTDAVGIAADDPDFLASVAMAQEALPILRQLWGARRPFDEFVVKKKFGQGDRVEHMWIEVSGMTADKITGVLHSTPIHLGDVKQGDKVTLSFHEVEDWTVATADGTYGSFSAKVLEQKRGK